MEKNLKQIYLLFVSAGLDVFKEKNAPTWLKEHPAFQNRNKVKKVFPSFGLKNFKEKVRYENKSNQEQNFTIKQMISDMYDQIAKVQENFKNLASDAPLDIDPIIYEILINYVHFLKNTQSAIFRAETIRKDGKVKIALTTDVQLGGKIIFKSGDSIFQIFNKINDLTSLLLKKYPILNTSSDTMLPNIDTLTTVKEFHKSNLPNKEYYVVFSSTGDEGIWDISTMSMRGIESCQSWDNSQYRSCLIGSILSKYVGIIYLTSGSHVGEYGTKMIKRCIVRFGVNTKNNEKIIILDKMYDSYDDAIANLFVDSLQKHTTLKVLNYAQNNTPSDFPEMEDVKIPFEKTLTQLRSSEQPYKDLPFLAQQNKIEKSESTDLLYETAFKISQEVRQNITNNILEFLTIQLLRNKLEKLIENSITSKINYKLAHKFIKIKMLKYMDSLYDLDIESILKILFPPQNPRHNWTIEEHANKLEMKIHQMREMFENTIRLYKHTFLNLF